MVDWNVAQITTKIRNLTGTPIDADGTSQLSNAEILDYINTYYTFTMPFELKEQAQLQRLDFYTDPNIPSYTPPSTFLMNSPEVYVDGQPMEYYEDRDIFLRDYPEQFVKESIGTGDGLTTNFTGTLGNIPLQQESLSISSVGQTANDVPDSITSLTGKFTGDVSVAGSINYLTGVYDVTFTTAPASGDDIYAKYINYSAAKPKGFLFYENEFAVRPIPDEVYKITLQGYINPTQFTGDADAPIFTEWGQLIAYGASLEIFADRGDLVGYNNMYPIFKRYENVALGRYVEQLQSQRGLPRF